MRAIRFPKLHEIQWLIARTTRLSHHILRRTSSRPKLKYSTSKLISGFRTSTMNRPGMRLLNSLLPLDVPRCTAAIEKGDSLHWIIPWMGVKYRKSRKCRAYRTPSVRSVLDIGSRMDCGWVMEMVKEICMQLDFTI